MFCLHSPALQWEHWHVHRAWHRVCGVVGNCSTGLAYLELTQVEQQIFEFSEVLSCVAGQGR